MHSANLADLKRQDVAEEPEASPSPTEDRPRQRRPARRVIHVTEVSSASESETEEVEVKLPKKKKPDKTPEQLLYERTTQKLFAYE